MGSDSCNEQTRRRSMDAGGSFPKGDKYRYE
jgi:hypothetical protein